MPGSRPWVGVLLVAVGCGGVDVVQERPEDAIHYVIASTLNVRARPDRSSTRVGQLGLNTMVTRLEEGEGGWVRVRPREGAEGWVAGSLLAREPLGYTRAWEEARTEPDPRSALGWWQRAAALCPGDLGTLDGLAAAYVTVAEAEASAEEPGWEDRRDWFLAEALQVRARRLEGKWCPDAPLGSSNCLRIGFGSDGEPVEPVQRLWGDAFFVGTYLEVPTPETRGDDEDARTVEVAGYAFQLDLFASGETFYGAPYEGVHSVGDQLPALEALLNARRGDRLARLHLDGELLVVEPLIGALDGVWAWLLARDPEHTSPTPGCPGAGG